MLLAPFLVPAFLEAASAGDVDALQPWRHVLALKIRDEGFGCARVVDVVEHGFEHEGRVALVVCQGGFSRDGDARRPYRVIFYTEGDITVRPWPRLEARGP